MNWIKARLNKDNFWNLMFLGSMTFGMSLTGLFANMDVAPLAFLSFWSTLIITPSLICSFNGVHIANKEFFNSQGQKLNTYPTNLFWPIAGAVLAVALSGALIDAHTKDLPISIAFAILITVFFTVPSLYFICINCPISILFNKHSWQPSVTGFTSSNSRFGPAFADRRRDSALSKFMRDNPITSASYSSLSSNIHNSNRWK